MKSHDIWTYWGCFKYVRLILPWICNAIGRRISNDHPIFELDVYQRSKLKVNGVSKQDEIVANVRLMDNFFCMISVCFILTNQECTLKCVTLERPKKI